MKKFISIFCLLSLFCLSSLSVMADQQKEQELDAQIKLQESNYKKLQKQMKDVNLKIFQSRKKEKNVTKQLNNLAKKVVLTQQKTNIVTAKIQKTENSIVVTKNNISDLEQQIIRDKKLLRARLINIYKHSQLADIDLLLSIKNTHDTMENVHLLSKIAKQDQELIASLSSKTKQLTASKHRLERENSNLKVQHEDLKQQNVQLKADTAEKNKLLVRVQHDKKLYLAELEEMKRAQRELDNTINRLIKQKKALRAKQGVKAEPETKYYTGGKLNWPCQGRISSQFGTRTHPVLKVTRRHTGLDIAAPKGTPVKPALPGEVLFTGWQRGYGNVIMVDHGGDMITVYGHLSKILVSEGQKVSSTTTIGLVGSTGMSTGNHLHFEVRINGKAQNPLNYLKR